MAGKIESPIKQLRRKFGMSQREFAMLIGKSSGHLSDLEAGVVSIADEILQELAAIGVDTEVLAKQHQQFMEQKRNALRQLSIENLKKSS